MSLPVEAKALKDFADAELAKLDEQRKEAIKAAGGLPYLPKLKVGETLVVLEAELPKDTEDPNKNARKQFVARYPGNQERYAWNVNPRSPLYRELLRSEERRVGKECRSRCSRYRCREKSR